MIIHARGIDAADDFGIANATGAVTTAGACTAGPIVVRRRRHSASGDVAMGLFGVALPLVTLLAELFTRMCATSIFDPIPTPLHVVLVALVPLGNLLALVASHRSDLTTRQLALVGILNGIAVGVTVCYGLLFLPLLPFAFIALIFFGLGLLPMAPVLGLITAAVCRERLRWPNPLVNPRRVPGFWPGMLGAILLLAMAAVPSLLTLHGLDLATDKGTRNEGIAFLRTWGSERELLTWCYDGGRGGGLRSPSAVVLGADDIDTDEARRVFYQVTGTSFDTHPSPLTARRGWAEGGDWDDGDWENRGGERVGGQLPGLALAASHIDGSVNADAVTAYYEWVMEFANDRPFPQEARCRIALPPDGVVSRLTLWINGEEREAAFGTRGQTRAAYEQVVKVERRDPVLVTTAGPDRVQMQCFPVPARGLMKVRVGITAPLQLAGSLHTGAVRLPCFADRNFAVPDAVLHDVSVESRAPLAASGWGPALEPGKSADGEFTLRGKLPEAALRDRMPVTVNRQPDVTTVWFDDPYDATLGTIVQRVEPYTEAAPPRVVLALDGSSSMSGVLPVVADTLTSLPPGVGVTAVVACDGLIVLEGGVDSVAGRLRAVECRGGQDSVPALARAWDVAAREPGAVVLWVHGAQPVTIDPTEPLTLAMDRNPNGPRLFHLQAAAGHNQVLEQLAEVVRVRPMPSPTGGVAQDLRLLFQSWSDGTPQWRLARDRATRPADGAADATTRQGDIQVVRLWANEEVARLTARRALGQSVDTRAAAELAIRHHLVTPVSGAVVLETQQQYAAAGLTPVTAIPLPAAVWMALLVAPLIWWLSRRAARPAHG